MNEGTLQSGTPSNIENLLNDTCQPIQDRCVRNETVPPEINSNKIREINIQEVNRGYIVRVGCHTFAISTKAELTTKLTEYINEPGKTERKWYDGNLF